MVQGVKADIRDMRSTLHELETPDKDLHAAETATFTEVTHTAHIVHYSCFSAVY